MSPNFLVSVPVTVAAPDKSARAAFEATILPALQRLAASLEIPVKLVVSYKLGSGSFCIGECVPLFRDPAMLPVLTFRLQDVWSLAGALITPAVARAIWQNWYPANLGSPATTSSFRQVLLEAVQLGYRVGRFREAFEEWPADSPRQAWSTRFEETISGNEIPRATLSLSPQLYTDLQTSFDWNGLFEFMIDGLFVELGITFPAPSVYIDDGLTATQFRFEWNDVRLPPCETLSIDELLVNDTADRLQASGFEGARETENPATRQPGSILNIQCKKDLEESGLTVWDTAGYIILSIAAILRTHAGAFVNNAVVEFLLYSLEAASPVLTAHVCSRFTEPTLVRIFRGLLEEEVSIRNLAAVLTAICLPQTIKSPGARHTITFAHRASMASTSGWSERDYIESVRKSLRSQLCHKFSRGTNTLVAYLMDAATEQRLASPARLRPSERQELLRGIRDEQNHLPPTAQMPLLLVSSDARWRLRQELFPEILVNSILSFDELTPELNVQPIARISPPFT